MAYTSIRPGQEWLDTEGKPIHAHAGSMFYEDGTFYWYGENKEQTRPGNGILHMGMRCYSSKDLYNWKDEGAFIPPDLENEASPLHPASKAERPHILYNRRTGKYVCWLKVMADTNTQTETVLEADRFLGPYTIVRTGLMPLGMNAGDFDLVAAPDGKAYYYFERVHSELVCADLSDDYTDVSGYYSTHFPLGAPPLVREAPAYFWRQGRHYLLTSGTTGYYPNPSEAAVADTFHGPWRVMGDLHPGDGSRSSYNSQISSVFRHPHKKDLYIALADRWVYDFAERDPDAFASGAAVADVQRQFAEMFSYDEEVRANRVYTLPPPDTSKARYVWLPLHFEGERPVIHWQEEWRVEDYE